MKAMYLLRVMEQYRMYQKDLHLVFIDLESACDKVPCKILWKPMKNKGVRVVYIWVIKDMYERVSNSVRTQDGDVEDFLITIWLQQGSTLSPKLFILVLIVLTEDNQEKSLRCVLFTYDIVIFGESREGLNGRLVIWRQTLETYGFRLSRSKT